jgi:hypothetical protein
VKISSPDGRVFEASGPLVRRQIRIGDEIRWMEKTPLEPGGTSMFDRGAVKTITKTMQSMGPGGELMATLYNDAIVNTNSRLNRLRSALEDPSSITDSKGKSMYPAYKPIEGVDMKKVGFAKLVDLDFTQLKPRKMRRVAGVAVGTFAGAAIGGVPGAIAGGATGMFAGGVAKKGRRQENMRAVVEDGATPFDNLQRMRAEWWTRMHRGVKFKKNIGVKEGDNIDFNVEVAQRVYDDHMNAFLAEGLRFGAVDAPFRSDGGSYLPLFWQNVMYPPSIMGFQVRNDKSLMFTKKKKVATALLGGAAAMSFSSPLAPVGTALAGQALGEATSRIMGSVYAKRVEATRQARLKVLENLREKGTMWDEKLEEFPTKKLANEHLAKLKADGMKNVKVAHVTDKPFSGAAWEVQLRRPIVEKDLDDYFAFKDNTRFSQQFGRTVDQLAENPAGHLEMHRLFGEVDTGRVYDPVELMERYAAEVVRRIEEMRAFGGRSLPHAQKILNVEARKDGALAERLKTLLDVGRGVHPAWDTKKRNNVIDMMRELNAAVSIKALGLAAPSQLTSWARVPLHSSFTASFQALFRAYERRLERDKLHPTTKRRQEHIDKLVAEHGHRIQSEWGVILRDGHRFIPKLSRIHLAYNGTLPVDAIGRQGAIIAGREHFRNTRLAYIKALRSGKESRIDLERRRMEEIFADEQLSTLALVRRNLTPSENAMLEQIAGGNVAARSSGRTEVVDMPLFAEHPYGQFLYKFMHFPIRMAAESHNEWARFRKWPLKEADKAAILRKIAVFAGLMGVVSPGLQRLRRMIKGQEKFDEPFWVEFLDLAAYAGYFTAYVDMFFNVSMNRFNSQVPYSGAVFEEILDVGDAVTSGFTQGMNPMSAYFIGWTPEPARSAFKIRERQRQFRLMDPVTLWEKIGLPTQVRRRGERESFKK